MTDRLNYSCIALALVLASCRDDPKVRDIRSLPQAVAHATPELVKAPAPGHVQKGDVFLYLNNFAYLKSKRFTGTVTEIRPGKITFQDGHVLYFRLPFQPQAAAGPTSPIKVGDVVDVDFRTDYFHVSIFRSVHVSRPGAELLMQIAQKGGVEPIDATIAGDSLSQGAAVDSVSMVSKASEAYGDVTTVLSSPGQQDTQLAPGTTVTHQVGGIAYRIHLQQSSRTTHANVELAGEGPPYHLYFSVLKR